MLFHRFIMVMVILSASSAVFSQDSTRIMDLERRLKELESRLEQEELARLKQEAESLNHAPGPESGSKTFQSRERSLQDMNPEISLASDFYGQYIFNEDRFSEDKRTGAYFRVAELMVQSDLDPFSMTRVIFEFTPDEIALAEAYITWSRMFKNTSLTVGQFKQSLGVVNRWHEHALDQFDYPLVITTFFGEEGLIQTGFSLDWFIPPLWSDASTLTMQITNGQNENLFSGEMFSFPALLGHLNSYYDLSRDAYLDLGFSGIVGENNMQGYDQETGKIMESKRSTWLLASDLTLLWEPVHQAKYKSLLWRTEAMYLVKEIESGQNITAFGGYSYLEYKPALRWSAGIRLDYTQPLQTDNNSLYQYQVVPYINWWQSEWVRFRLQYNYIHGENMDWPAPNLILQVNWALGPHKHERY